MGNYNIAQLIIFLNLGTLLISQASCPSCGPTPPTKPPPKVKPPKPCPPTAPSPPKSSPPTKLPPPTKSPPKSSPPTKLPPPTKSPPMASPPKAPPTKSPPPKKSPPMASPPKAPEACPIDVLKLGACVDVLNGLVHIGIGPSAKDECCAVLEGVAGLDAALCLCTTIKAKLLNVNILLPIALQVLVDCGKNPPSGFQCPT